MKQATLLSNNGDFLQNLGGYEITKNGAIVVSADYSADQENVIASTAYGTKLKIRFSKLLKTLRNAICWYIARSQMGDPTELFVRSKLGTWQCQADYIHETIQREKMRGYDFRAG